MSAEPAEDPAHEMPAGAGGFERSDLERFFGLSVDMLCIASMDGYLLEVNPAFTRLLGLSATELRSRPFLEFVHPDDRA